MTAKQKAIGQAYKEHWEQVKDYVDGDGWCDSYYEELGINYYGSDAELINFTKWRPKSLQGIEDNNGWTVIENEKDLPSDSEKRYCSGKFTSSGKFCVHMKDTNFYAVAKSYHNGLVTHYIEVYNFPNPLY